MFYRIGDITVDTLRAEISLAGRKVMLRPQSFEVLVYLLQRPGRVVTKLELQKAVWGNKVVTEGSLSHCLMEIREAIGDHQRTVVRTIARRGYMLDAAVTKQSVEADKRISILVAPVSDQGIGDNDAYIADGLTEEIITALSKIESLRVIARASAMRLKGAGEALPEIARELGVDFVLDGSCRSWGDRLRVNMELRRLDSDAVRWSEQYDGKLGNLFEIQNQIASSLAYELAIRTKTTEPSRDEVSGNYLASEAYFRARHEMWKFSQQGLQQAEQILENGLELLGPDTRLLGLLGQVYAKYGELGLDPTGSLIDKAAQVVQKIFERNPDSARGHLLLGVVRFNSGDLLAARAPLEKSLKANPSESDALMMLGYLCALSGPIARASQLFDQLLDIDPLTPINHCMPGFVELMEGRNEQALPHYKRFLELEPQNPFAIWAWSYVLLRNGRIREAAETIQQLDAEYGGTALATLGSALFYGVSAKPKAARQAVTDELRMAARNNEFFSREVTHCLALAGETEEALDWLENTVRIGNVNYPFWAQHDEWVSSLRGEARFQELMSDVKKAWIANVCHEDNRY